MRSIAEQSVEELGGSRSVLALQKRDHVQLDQLLTQLSDAPTAAAQDDVLTRVNRLVFSHAFAEEAVLWPTLRRHLPDGEALTLQVEQEHQEVNELVTSLERTGPDDPNRERLLQRLVDVLRQDVRDEEDELLPRLQQAVDVAELRRLGAYWLVIRWTAPTRPHPVVARRPPGNVLAALPLSAIDRSRDLLDHGARRAPGAVAPALQHASRALAAVAGRAERLGPFRRGEHASTSRPATGSEA